MLDQVAVLQISDFFVCSSLTLNLTFLFSAPARTRAIMKDFGTIYEKQYAVALFNSVRFEIEGGGTPQTQLLHRKVHYTHLYIQVVNISLVWCEMFPHTSICLFMFCGSPLWLCLHPYPFYYGAWLFVFFSFSSHWSISLMLKALCDRAYRRWFSKEEVQLISHELNKSREGFTVETQ